MTHCGASGAKDWDPAQFLFHDPLEVNAKVAIEREDIYLALVVGNDHVGLPRIDPAATLDLNGDHHHQAVKLGPDRS